MHPFPHLYQVECAAASTGEVLVTSRGLPPLATTTPPEFGGPAGSWSPETLLVAAAVDCYVLTFRGLARAGRLTWVALEVDGAGTLERVDGVTRFTAVHLTARLLLPAEASEEQARRLLARAEETCLITRSLTAETHLDIEVTLQTQCLTSLAGSPMS